MPDSSGPDLARAQAERLKRLALIGLTPDDVKAPPIVVQSDQHFVFSSENAAANLWMKPLKPARSLDELKELVGVPNRVFEHNNTKHLSVHPEVQNAALKSGDGLSLTDQNSVARRTAENLVYGYADPTYVAQPSVDELTQMMCSALGGQFAVVGTALTVQNGGKVDLGPNPVVQFDSITVYGTGQIIVHPNQKVQATTVTWLPA